MNERFLAIVAMVATVFAFGVGAALAEQPEVTGAPDPHPACESDDPPDWCEGYDGRPGDRDGDDDDGEQPEEPAPGPEALCEALGQAAGELQWACEQLISAVGGGGGEEPPAQPGPQDVCDGIRGADPQLAPVADGCDQRVANLPAA